MAYYFNGKRIAMRTGVPATYLHGDMSTSIAKSELRYTPFGRIRLQSSWTETDRRFTGQQEEEGIELYDYGARFYSPLLGRFVSPDSVVPDLHNPQSLNRYSYVYNRPVTLVDPTGHAGEPPDKRGCKVPGCGIFPPPLQENENSLNVSQAETVVPVIGPDGISMAQTNSLRQKVRDFGDTIGMKFDCRGLAALLCSEAAKQAVEKAAKLVNGDGDPTNEVTTAINITEKGLKYVLDRHTNNGIEKWANKSKFLDASEVIDLIKQAAKSPAIQQANQNFVRVIDAGRNIGVDRATGKATSVYTVVTDSAGNLVTAYPGQL